MASLEALQPLSNLLSVDDAKIIMVALTAIDNILRQGEIIARQSHNTVANPYAEQIEECFGKYWLFYFTVLFIMFFIYMKGW